MASSSEKTWHRVYMICNRKRDPFCKQLGITIEDFNKQIDSILAKVTVPNDFIDWTMGVLRRIHSEESAGQNSIESTIQATLAANTRKQENLFAKYMSEANAKGEIIGDEEYKVRKESLRLERSGLEERLSVMGRKLEDWLDTAERVFNFVKNARYWLEHGTVEDKRTILTGLGLHPT
ncbi:MAG: hypothetical protein Q8Q24_02070, partial [bacterium]|nr:hypothetical protein [bacterium]